LKIAEQRQRSVSYYNIHWWVSSQLGYLAFWQGQFSLFYIIDSLDDHCHPFGCLPPWKAHLGKARKTMCQNFLAIQVPSICGFLPFQVPNFRVNSSVESLKGEGILVNIFLISEVVLF
jgi:hypothetical protein